MNIKKVKQLKLGTLLRIKREGLTNRITGWWENEPHDMIHIQPGHNEFVLFIAPPVLGSEFVKVLLGEKIALVHKRNLVEVQKGDA